MATITLTSVFPAGTSVEARLRSAWPTTQQDSPSGTPGSAVATATTATDGTTTFSGLPDGTRFIASGTVDGATRYVHFSTDDASSLLGPPNTQTVDYTLVIGDENALVEINAATAKTVTIPPNSSVAFATGTQLIVRQYGAGQVTVAAGVGVTLRARASAVKTAGQYAEATLTKRATDEWVLSGDLIP